MAVIFRHVTAIIAAGSGFHRQAKDGRVAIFSHGVLGINQLDTPSLTLCQPCGYDPGFIVCLGFVGVSPVGPKALVYPRKADRVG